MADDRAPINFVGERERDFTRCHGICDFIVGEKLPRGVTGRERNLHFQPDGVEAVTGDGVNHRNEGLASGQASVRLEDEVEGFVMLN